MSTLMVEPEIEVGAKPQRRRFTVDEFQRMGEAGIFAPEERVELISGEVFRMSPTGPRHTSAVIHLTRYLTRLLGNDLLLSVQCPMQVGAEQLVPDFAVLRPRNYRNLLPQPSDCVLLVEVAEWSIEFDTKSKARRYAMANIAEDWVLDLPGNRVLVHRGPEAGGYREVAPHPRGSSFTSPALGGATIRVDDLLAGGA
ncbi:MAG TPA: Uma2 family endonuclease [Longimicrobium sp.]